MSTLDPAGSPLILKVVNESPAVKAGATMFDFSGLHSVQLFGQTFCLGSGCVISNPGNYSAPVSGKSRIGIQWNINRVAVDGQTCDQPCRQIDLDMHKCQATLVPSSEGYCSPAVVNTPTWTPTLNSSVEGNTCVLTVASTSHLDNGADLCSCVWGQYPCDCATGASGPNCQGRKPSV